MRYFVASCQDQGQAHQILVPIALEAETPKTGVIHQVVAYLHSETGQTKQQVRFNSQKNSASVKIQQKIFNFAIILQYTAKCMPSNPSLFVDNLNKQ